MGKRLRSKKWDRVEKKFADLEAAYRVPQVLQFGAECADVDAAVTKEKLKLANLMRDTRRPPKKPKAE